MVCHRPAEVADRKRFLQRWLRSRLPTVVSRVLMFLPDTGPPVRDWDAPLSEAAPCSKTFPVACVRDA